jgi:predicted RNA-binding Zn ribbon-like protein
MSKRERTASSLDLVGGRLCLDFANTVSTRAEGQRHEYLARYGDLVAWGQHAQILAGKEAEALLHDAACRPTAAHAELEHALQLRETIYRVFSAVAGDREPETTDLATLNTALRETLARLEVHPSPGGFQWRWVADEGDLDRILWPIVRSAADLLTSEDLGRVRECAREGCDWLFVDLSKNHSRRWCSMAMCGSRVKSRRYYQRREQRK